LKPYFQTIKKSSKPLGFIHSGINDLKFLQTRGGKKYYVTFINNYTRYCYTYLLGSKDKALIIFKHYKNDVKDQLDKKIKVIRSDRCEKHEASFSEFYS